MSSNPPLWKRLINPQLPTNDRIRLIETIFTDRDEAEVLKYLSENDVQAFVDVIDEASVQTPLSLENELVESH